MNAAIFIKPSQTDAVLDAYSVGSSTVGQIPGFFITNFLGAGQSMNFNVNLEQSTGVQQFSYGLLPTGNLAATPEPSTILLLGTGLFGIAGAVRKRFSEAV